MLVVEVLTSYNELRLYRSISPASLHFATRRVFGLLRGFPRQSVLDSWRLVTGSRELALNQAVEPDIVVKAGHCVSSSAVLHGSESSDDL